MSRARRQYGAAAKSGNAGWAGSVIRSSGFTIVELLVVIGIASLLIAMLLPTLSKARAQANSLSCQARLQQIGEAIQIYMSSSRGVLPYGYWDGSFSTATGITHGRVAKLAADWTQLLQRGVFPDSPGGVNAKVRQMFYDPDAPQDGMVNGLGQALAQYVCHPRLMPEMGTEDKYAAMGTSGPKFFLRPYQIARVARSSEIGLIFDASVNYVAGGGYSVFAEPVAMQMDGGRILSDTYLTDQYNLASTAAFVPGQGIDLTPGVAGGPVNSDDSRNPQNVRFRHMNNRICNVLMVDFHVESFSWSASGGTDLLRKNVNVNP
jgi:prepilin-type processing-associated H-X9-DG protein